MEKENVIQKIQKLLKLQCGAESIGLMGNLFSMKDQTTINVGLNV